MIAPLIPYLASKFAVSRDTVGLMVPAYLFPYAIGTFAYGLLADRFGRRGILVFCLTIFALCCALTAMSHSAHDMIIWRILTGFAGSGVAVVALTLIGDLFPFVERGRALGWLFGTIAGGKLSARFWEGCSLPWLAGKACFWALVC